MEAPHTQSHSNASGPACALRQIRHNRQADRAMCVLLGFTILSVLVGKFTASLAAGAEDVEQEQQANILATLPKPFASDRSYVIEPPDILSVELTDGAAADLTGEHLVRPDGTIDLGGYGSAHVTGLTVAEAKLAIENQLKDRVESPQVSAAIHAYNSKVYYVIVEGAGKGDSIVRVPFTGNETVLDALAQVNGLPQLANKNIWIARPAPGGVNCDQILPVSWAEIGKGNMSSNHRVLPRDRIFIAEDKMIALDNWFNRHNDPVEWFFGYSPLSSTCGVSQGNPLRDLLMKMLSP